MSIDTVLTYVSCALMLSMMVFYYLAARDVRKKSKEWAKKADGSLALMNTLEKNTAVHFQYLARRFTKDRNREQEAIAKLRQELRDELQQWRDLRESIEDRINSALQKDM